MDCKKCGLIINKKGAPGWESLLCKCQIPDYGRTLRELGLFRENELLKEYQEHLEAMISIWKQAYKEECNNKKSWIDDEDIPRFDLDIKNTAELLNNEKIASWTRGPDFYRFSQDQYWNGGWHLMAEFNDGYKWYVLGTANEELNLPEWKPKIKVEERK